MLQCQVLCYVTLYYTKVLYYNVSYYTILYCTVWHYITLYSKRGLYPQEVGVGGEYVTTEWCHFFFLLWEYLGQSTTKAYRRNVQWRQTFLKTPRALWKHRCALLHYSHLHAAELCLLWRHLHENERRDAYILTVHIILISEINTVILKVWAKFLQQKCRFNHQSFRG